MTTTPSMEASAPNPKRHTTHQVFCLVAYIVALAITIYSLVSCGVQRPVITRKDSIRVEIRERIVRDTAYFQLPAQSSSIITRDTTSVIELDYAKSTASVRDGFLHHSLETKPETLEVPVYISVHDTTTVEIKGDTIYVDVPRLPTKWESFLEVCGYILLGAVVVSIIALALKLALQRL